MSRLSSCTSSKGTLLVLLFNVVAVVTFYSVCIGVDYMDPMRRGHNNAYGSAVKDPHSLFEHDSLPASLLLNQRHSPNIVYYIWCGRRTFEFTHYLSVLSVIRHLRPDNIIFYYNETTPVLDNQNYNTWYQELCDAYPFFRGQKLEANERACLANSTKASINFVSDLLTRRGGMYMNERTILTRFPVKYRLANLLSTLDTETGTGFLMISRVNPSVNGTSLKSLILNNTMFSSNISKCLSQAQFIVASKSDNKKSLAPSCLVVDGTWHPKDIWELDNFFGRLARTLFYGGPNILRAIPTYKELVPNIAHLVWIGGGEINFLFYLGVLSLIHVAKVDTVYIHGEAPPSGHYWDLLRNETRLQLIHREPPEKIYGVAVNDRSHVSDAWRVDIILKYGGIYMDTDAVFVRPLDQEIRAYDAVATYDWPWNPPFPDIINFGVTIGKRKAPFWKLESMHSFNDKDWTWNGLRQPYRIMERKPDLLRIDPHLQVVCYLSKCHPTWWPDYNNEDVHHLNRPIKNWRQDAYAYHWTHPVPHELQNYHNLLTDKASMFTEIGQFILRQAGMLDYFTKILQDDNRKKVPT